jgi:hypothetical protein
MISLLFGVDVKFGLSYGGTSAEGVREYGAEKDVWA